jgi:DNA-binding SARP family transcriptional activator
LWISGPAGCGKTTLVSTYLEAREKPAFWYHVDPADSDPANFFYYLSELAEPLRRRSSNRLPFLTPEYLAEISGYTRRFFRLLFERMPEGAVLVLDDAHESTGTTLPSILRDALNELPAGKSVICVSRVELPRELSRHAVNDRVGLLGWDDLRLRPEETTAVAQARSANVEQVESLHSRAKGWVAGLLLLLASRDTGKSGLNLDSPATVFDYFAGELFDRLDPSAQSLLLAVAFLPRFTPDMARSLTSQQDAPAILEKLRRGHLFLERSSDDRGRHLYTFHDLFRDFLLQRAREIHSPGQLNELRSSAALILVDHHAHEAAVDLLQQSGDFETLLRIILERAEQMLAQGRWKTLLSWIGSLPETLRSSSPWSMYWLGMAQSATNASAARAILERAFEGFESLQDPEPRILCCSRIMDTYLQEWNTVQSMDRWIAEMEKLLAPNPILSDPLRMRTLSSLVQCLVYRQPSHPSLPAFAEETGVRLQDMANRGDQVSAVTFLIFYYDVTGAFDRALQLISATQEIAQSPDVLPSNTCLWWHFSALHFYYVGNFVECERRHRIAAAIADEHGIRALRCLNCMVKFMSELAQDDLAGGQVSLDELGRLINPTHYMHQVCLVWGRFWKETLAKDESRLDELWAAFGVMPPVGVPWNAAFNHPVVMFLAHRKQHEAALQRVRRWTALLAEMKSPFIEFNMSCMESYVRLDQGDADGGRICLQRMMTIGAHHDYRNTLAWIPSMLSTLCAKALEWSIEPDYVRMLIRTRRIPPPRVECMAWPRLLRIFLLGRFEVYRDGVLLEFPRKAPRKTLALLKAIASSGRAGVSTGQVADWLWPDLDGDAAQDALGTSLHRLRRLIGVPEAVVLHEGRLRMDADLCWTDSTAFEDLTRESDSPAIEELHQVVLHTTRALDLYRGGLLPLDREEHWLGPARERLRGKFLRFISATGRQLEAAGRITEAVAGYKRGLDADPLAEEFYQGLMRCYAAQGRAAEAASVFRQLKQVLSVVNGAEPSQASKGLYARLSAAST